MNIFFSGIGGVGIGPLAEIARDAGHTVQGSDSTDGLITQELQKSGVSIAINQDGVFLQACHDDTPIDWFVYTAALPADHPELRLARTLGIKTAKRDELLAYIIDEKDMQLIAVAGTHGKTTTTGMLVWTIQQLGIPVSYSVGSTLSFGPSGKFDPASHYFVYECDEFDRNFLHFHSYLSLITSIDYDHPDTYPTEASYTAAFRQFVNQSDTTIMWKTDGDKIAASADDGWVLSDNEVMDIHLPGAHNRRNATLVLKGIEYLKLKDTTVSTSFIPATPPRGHSMGGDASPRHSARPDGDIPSDDERQEQAQQTQNAAPLASSRSPSTFTDTLEPKPELTPGPNLGLERCSVSESTKQKGDQEKSTRQILELFPGTDRRFERLADNLYSDYGHHPVEIAATLQLARELSDHVVLVYQPHQNVRQHEIRDQYTDQFDLAESIYWLPTYLSREDPNLTILTPDELTQNITNKAALHIAECNDELWHTIQTARDDGKLVLGMGAGSIDSWLRQQLTNNTCCVKSE